MSEVQKQVWTMAMSVRLDWAKHFVINVDCSWGILVCVREVRVCVCVCRDICIEAAKLVREAEQMPHTPLNGGLSRT